MFGLVCLTVSAGISSDRYAYTVDHFIHIATHNCEGAECRPCRIHVGHRCISPDPNYAPTSIWQTIRVSRPKGMSMSTFICAVNHLTKLHYVKTILFSSILVFAVGSALCGAAQVRKDISDLQVVPQRPTVVYILVIVDILVDCCTSTCWDRRRRYCCAGMEYYKGARQPHQLYQMVNGAGLHLDSISRRRATAGWRF